MIISLNPNKFRVGDEVYLLTSGGCCLVTITDCYKYNDDWFYSVNADNYTTGLELEWVSEKSISKKTYARKYNKPIPIEIMESILEEFNERQ